MDNKKRVGGRVAFSVAIVGVMAATVECGKLILSFIPNVEVVTLLLALFGYVFGPLGVLSAFIFVSIEPLLYGFGAWTITYYVYWPLVSLVFMLLARLRIKNRWILTFAAVLLTFFFGVLSSLVDIGLFSGSYDDFFKRFFIYYSRGVVFYVIQMVCNAVIFPSMFLYLKSKLEFLRRKYY